MGVTRYATRFSAKASTIAQINTNRVNIAGGSVDNTSFRAAQLYMRMKNTSGSTIPQGIAVMADTGSDNLGVEPANNNTTSKRVLGITKASSANGADVDVIYGGKCDVLILSGQSLNEHNYIKASTDGKSVSASAASSVYAITLEACDASGGDELCECVITVSELV